MHAIKPLDSAEKIGTRTEFKTFKRLKIKLLANKAFSNTYA